MPSDPSEPACVTRTCSLPRQKRMGDCASPSPSQANVAVVSPMPHMTKVGGGQTEGFQGDLSLNTQSASVSETGSKKQCCGSQENGENGDEALRGEICGFYMENIY